MTRKWGRKIARTKTRTRTTPWSPTPSEPLPAVKEVEKGVITQSTGERSRFQELEEDLAQQLAEDLERIHRENQNGEQLEAAFEVVWVKTANHTTTYRGTNTTRPLARLS